MRTNHDTEREAVEKHPCAECGQLLALELDTPIGLRSDGRPGALCSKACADSNARRILDCPADSSARCACGTEVDLDTQVLILRGAIVGCTACDWSGSCRVPHYLSPLGGAMCGTSSRIARVEVTTTTNPKAVKCPACRELLRLAPKAFDLGVLS